MRFVCCSILLFASTALAQAPLPKSVGTENEQKLWDALSRLGSRVIELERKADHCKCGERSVLPTRRSRVYSVVQTPDDGSCVYCEPFKDSIRDVFPKQGWVLGDNGDVRFAVIKNDGGVFPRTIIYRDGVEVRRVLKAVSPTYLSEAINQVILSTK